jgi:hypothetical protein
VKGIGHAEVSAIHNWSRPAKRSSDISTDIYFPRILEGGSPGGAHMRRPRSAASLPEHPNDPASRTLAAVALSIIAIGATLVPAGRALSAHPAMALRTE